MPIVGKRFYIWNQIHIPLKHRLPLSCHFKGFYSYNNYYLHIIFTTSNIFHFRRARQRSRKDRRTPRNFQAFKDAAVAAAADNRRAVDASSPLPDVRWRHTSRAPTKNVDDADAGKSSKVKKRHIVFLKDSPDYCLASSSSSKIGSHQGVLGRKCSADPNSPNPEAGVKKCSKLCRSCGLQVVNCFKTNRPNSFFSNLIILHYFSRTKKLSKSWRRASVGLSGVVTSSARPANGKKLKLPAWSSFQLLDIYTHVICQVLKLWCHFLSI